MVSKASPLLAEGCKTLMPLPERSLVFSFLPYGSSSYQAAVQLREQVLRHPLGLSFRPEDLENERTHLHFGGTLEKRLVATAILVPEDQKVKIRQVALLQDLQGQGIGSAMLDFCESYARKQGFSEIYCHARLKQFNFILKTDILP